MIQPGCSALGKKNGTRPKTRRSPSAPPRAMSRCTMWNSSCVSTSSSHSRFCSSSPSSGGDEENHRVVERHRRGESVGEVGRVEHHHVDARSRLPAQQLCDARQDAFRHAGNDARLAALALGEMHREIRGFQGAPAQRRIDERELRPLRLAGGQGNSAPASRPAAKKRSRVFICFSLPVSFQASSSWRRRNTAGRGSALPAPRPRRSRAASRSPS